MRPVSGRRSLNQNCWTPHQITRIRRGGGPNGMARTVSYWVTIGLVAAMGLMSAYFYLSGSQQAVEGFAHVGYPQQLRVLLGIAKLLGALTLVVPGWPRLKEWAYAGFTFAWIAAFVAHYLDWRQSFFPVNDKQISLSFLTDTSSSRGCGKRGNPAGCAGFPREVGREGNRLLVFLAFHGPAFSTAQRRPRFAFS